MSRRLAAGAHRDHAPAEFGAAEQDMADQSRDQEQHRIDRHAEQEAGAGPVPCLVEHEGAGQVGAVVQRQHVEQRPVDDERHQGGQERPRLHEADEEAVDAAERGPDRDARRDREPERQLVDVEAYQDREIDQREDGADAEVDAARDQRQADGERDEAQLGELPQQRADVGEGEVVGNHRAEIENQSDERREWDDGLHPGF